MNPCDAMPKDYSMYYDGCWMEHSKHGIGRIRVMDGDMWLSELPDGAPELRVKPSYLSCWWPRPGAFNLDGRAVYIARRAMRNMRKSAVGNDHYFVKWGRPNGVQVMRVLRQGPQTMTINDGIDKIVNEGYTSVAVSRDIIISPESEGSDIYTVTFRGMEVGTICDGQFESGFSNNPLIPRILRQLELRA